MGYFLAMSGISMFLTIVSSAIYIIAISYIPNGHVLYIFSILSAIFVSITSILHILALRKYGKDNQEKSSVGSVQKNWFKSSLQCCFNRKSPQYIASEITKVSGGAHSL
jgi:hypothetical protein